MSIDLNADVGEGLAAMDAAIIPLLSSANIACGGHAGDARTMRQAAEHCIRHGVAIGAHPGYPDREGFGRRPMDIDDDQLRSSIRGQLEALAAATASLDGYIGHVKPHGTLYNRAAAERPIAALIAAVVHAWDPRAVLVGRAGSVALEAGRDAGLKVVPEGFADRAYEPDGRLRPRSQPGAVHSDPRVVANQAVSIARDGRAPLQGGGSIPVSAETLCFHGDSAGAIENIRAARAALGAAGVPVIAWGAA